MNKEDTIFNTPNFDKERYEFLMEESIKQFPYACNWLIHTAVCEQLAEESGVEFDENNIEELKKLYCNKLEYDDMITIEN